MIFRQCVARRAGMATRHLNSQLVPTRGLASSAGAGSFEPSAAAGVKLAARNSSGPTTKLAIVARAGTRYQPLPGLTAGLESFAFKNTQKRSALRIIRESELLGGQLTSYYTREALVLEASFLSNDLPYFVELLNEVLTQTKYTTHEFHEEVQEVLRAKQQAASSSPLALALDAAHATAFHHGLGSPLALTASTPIKPYISEYAIAEFASAAYAKENIAIVADGTSESELSKWTGQFFQGAATSSGQASSQSTPSKYHGGESRTPYTSGNAMVIGFPGATNVGGGSSAEVAVLAALLGGKSNIKWSPGFSLLSRAVGNASGLSTQTANLSYSDAGLFTVQLSGSALAVRKAAEATVASLKSISAGSVSKEDLAKAIAKAKFDALESSERRDAALLQAGSGLLQGGKPLSTAASLGSVESVTAKTLQTTAQTILEGKASVGTFGDLHILPFAEELGLRV